MYIYIIYTAIYFLNFVGNSWLRRFCSVFTVTLFFCMKDTHEFNIWDLLSQNLEKKSTIHTPQRKSWKLQKENKSNWKKSGEKMWYDNLTKREKKLWQLPTSVKMWKRQPKFQLMCLIMCAIYRAFFLLTLSVLSQNATCVIALLL